MNKLHKDQITILLAGVITLLLLGLLYVWSIFVAPLEYEFGWNRAQTSLTYTISMIFFMFGMMAAGYIGRKKSLRFANLLGVCLVGIGFAGVSQTNSLMMFYLFYGVCAGFGIGLCYNAWLSTVLSHFPGRTGLASGWLLLGFGMGAALGPLVYAMISPLGWRNVFIAIGILIFLEGIIAMHFLHPHIPDAAAEKPSGQSRSQAAKEQKHFTCAETMREPSFWIFCTWKTIIFCTGIAIVGQTAPIMLDMGAEPAAATLAVVLISAGNSIGRVATGMFFDRFGYAKTMMLSTWMFLGSSLIYLLCYPIGMVMPVNLAMFLLGISCGGTVIVTASFINTTFGQTHFSSHFAVSSATNLPAILVLSSAISIIRAETGVYTGYFVVMVALGVISLLLTIWTHRSVNKMRRRLA